MKVKALTTSLAVATVVVAGGACRSSATDSRLMAEGPRLSIGAEELRIKIRALTRPFGGMIEEAADRIAVATADRDLRRLALEFKIDAVPAMHEALFQPDPLAAVLDAGVLLVQMRDYFERTVADRVPEGERTVVLAAVERMRDDLDGMLVRAGSDPSEVADGWALVERWAAKTPVTGTFASRRTTAGLLAEFTARTGTGALAGLGSIGEDLDDLTARVDVYLAHLAKQVRWQAELVLLDALGEDGSVVETIAAAAPFEVEVRRLPAPLDTLPDELAAIVDAEHRELAAWIRAERVEILAFVRGEREAVLATVAAERDRLIGEIATQREAALAGLAAERERTLEEARRIASETLAEARSELVDHAALRAAQVLGGFAVLAFVGALVLIWAARRP